MSKEDIIRKLSSRKFWTAVAEFVGMLIIAMGAGENTAAQVTSLIMAGAAVIAYIVAEGLTDAASAKMPVIIQQQPPDAE